MGYGSLQGWKNPSILSLVLIIHKRSKRWMNGFSTMRHAESIFSDSGGLMVLPVPIAETLLLTYG